MIFSDITAAPADPILGLTDAFKKDPRAEKVNLGVGIYKDETGQTPVLASVKLAEEKLVTDEKTKSYLSIEGAAVYNKVVQTLILGNDNPLIDSGRVVTAQAPGGTGSLRVAAEFLVNNTGVKTIWVSNPTWANHKSIFNSVGLNIAEYRYYNPANHGLDFDNMLQDLQQAVAGDIILLHGCCHNPTGIDLTAEQWQIIADLCVEKSLVPLFDFAYQGFGTDIDADAQGIRTVAKVVPELLIANSFSKNFGLYNERIGALTLIASDSDAAERSFSQLKRTIRANYSNPPAHGAMIVSTILSDAELTARWVDEVTQMRERIAQMRVLFVEELKKAGVEQDFSFISRQNGMFSFSGLNKEQVARLKNEFGVYIVGSGRISVAGMTKENIPVICKAIAQVL